MIGALIADHIHKDEANDSYHALPLVPRTSMRVMKMIVKSISLQQRAMILTHCLFAPLRRRLARSAGSLRIFPEACFAEVGQLQ